MHRRQFLAVLALGCGLRLAGAAPKKPLHQLLHATFECTLPLSKAQKVGLEAATVTFSSQAKKPDFEVLVCEIGKEAFAAMKEAGQDPLEYAKTTYLGISQTATKQVSRNFVQGPQSADVYPESFPHKDYLEVFWLERKEGAGLMLAFRVSKQMDFMKASEAMDQICSTLQWKL